MTTATQTHPRIPKTFSPAVWRCEQTLEAPQGIVLGIILSLPCWLVLGAAVWWLV